MTDEVTIPGFSIAEIIKALTAHAAAIAASASAIATTDLTKIENYVLAVAPTVVAAAFNWVRRYLKLSK